MFVLAADLSLRLVPGRVLEVELQPIPLPDRVEPFPRLAEREAELVVVRDRARKVVDKELWS
jgi:hypothetical protein